MRHKFTPPNEKVQAFIDNNKIIKMETSFPKDHKIPNMKRWRFQTEDKEWHQFDQRID